MSEYTPTTEEVRKRYTSNAHHVWGTSEEFNRWLSELIRKEREDAWDECLSEMPLDLDWKLQYGDQNPYRKEQP